MSDNLPPLIPAAGCPASNRTAISTPVLLRSALEGPPLSYPAEGAGAILDPAGTDNDIVVVANQPGAAGNGITVAITAPAVTIPTYATVEGMTIVIINGGRSRMLVTGAGSPIFNGTYRHAGNFSATTRPYWRKIDSGADFIYLVFPNADNIPTGEWLFTINGDAKYASDTVTYNVATQPQSMLFHSVGGGVNPPPTVVSAVGDAQQAINALSLSPEASVLVSAAPLPGETALGALNALSAIPLTGGQDGQQGTTPMAIGQFCRVGPYPLLPPRTQEYDWFIAETMSTWRPVFE